MASRASLALLLMWIFMAMEMRHNHQLCYSSFIGGNEGKMGFKKYHLRRWIPCAMPCWSCRQRGSNEAFWCRRLRRRTAPCWSRSGCKPTGWDGGGYGTVSLRRSNPRTSWRSHRRASNLFNHWQPHSAKSEPSNIHIKSQKVSYKTLQLLRLTISLRALQTTT